MPLKFGAPSEVATEAPPPVALVRTNSKDNASELPASDGFRSKTGGRYDAVPTGNAVDLPQEMMEVAANEMDYETVSALYVRSLSLIKTALGKS